MQHQNNEIVLKLDVSMKHDLPLTYDQAANYLGQVIRMSNTTPYQYSYIDKPSAGDMHAIFQIQSLPPFTVDGLRYLEAEHVYTVSLGVVELEVAETKYGFIPGMNEQHASRMRRKMRFSKGGMPAVVLVHYSQGPAVPIPPAIANQPVRKYPLIPSTEPAIYVMGEKTGQKVPYPQGQQPAMNGQGYPPHGAPQRGPISNPPAHPHNAAIAAQNAAMNAHRGPVPKPLILDENEEDESDLVTHRDVATTRFVRNHEFLAELFSAEPLPEEMSPDLDNPEELEETLARINAEIEAMQQKTAELEAVRLTNEASALTV